MANCDTILAKAIEVDCSNPQTAGMEADGIIINRADVDFDACTRTGNTISALALKTGKKGYFIYQMGSKPFTGSNTSFTANDYRNKFTKNVSFCVFDHSADCAENIIDKLANGEFVVILKNKYKGSDSQSIYEVFGFEAGMKQTEGSRDPYSDIDGGWQVTLQEIAPSSAVFFYSTSLTATAAAYEALTA